MSYDLLIASLHGYFDKVKTLLAKKYNSVDIHYQSQDGYNALMHACEKGHVNIVKYLLTSNELKTHSNIHEKNNNGESALYLACERGHLEIVKYLLTSDNLKEQANIHERNNNGLNPLISACKEGQLDVVKYLLTSKDLKEHANMYDKNNNNVNILRYGCSLRHFEIVKYLIIEQNFQVDDKTMDWLIENNKQEVLDMITTRDLYQKFNDSLSIKNSSIKQRKI